jgi:hypothetical protein
MKPNRIRSSALKRTAFELRWRASCRPIFLPGLQLLSRRAGGDALKLVSESTDIVVEGFQGCGNSLFCTRFLQAQPELLVLAGHAHVPAQVLAATSRGLPTLALIRDPVASVASLVSRWPYVSTDQALRAYTGFYQVFETHTPRLIVATYEQVVRDHAGIVERLNARFGSSFSVNHRVTPPRDERDKEREERKVRTVAALESGTAGPRLDIAMAIWKRFESLAQADR